MHECAPARHKRGTSTYLSIQRDRQTGKREANTHTSCIPTYSTPPQPQSHRQRHRHKTRDTARRDPPSGSTATAATTPTHTRRSGDAAAGSPKDDPSSYPAIQPSSHPAIQSVSQPETTQAKPTQPNPTQFITRKEQAQKEQ
ncbi:uncharacterized protein K452DRAFT_286777 [Aplosporella prunicola CBS 121167]|uniref:Uncharacterized protein n=1 Tax=Aplosporella prunicola CBS 121167 TaxID=1176127 RepID=A0A6A6BDV3_9PEZI|nr:uncharacterized protein K452DRAFT_286777 [Aplosporella prunicola CBS 121167]KAF2142350.1 hypothetical protein K452DRAFT_286777 [Aplosporella prunicola CBS 121167]